MRIFLTVRRDEKHVNVYFVKFIWQHESKKRDEITSRKVDENRAESKQLMIESLLPPAQTVCSAAVHVENTIGSADHIGEDACHLFRKVGEL